MKMLTLAVIGYLVGSIPFALVIGKVFYKTDVRKHGSGNLGGGNTGRVLGKKAGVAVMTLDILKVAFVVFLANRFLHTETAVACGGLAAAVGHCWPVFAGFRGGKAVATMYGFLFGLFVFAGYSPLVFFLPLSLFLLVLKLTKIISLSSIVSSAVVTIYVCLSTDSASVGLALVIFTILIVARHRKNIERICKHQENKVSWM